MKRNITTIVISAVVSALLILPAFSAANEAKPAPDALKNSGSGKLTAVNKPKPAAKEEAKETQEVKDDFDIQSLSTPSPCILQSLRLIGSQSLQMFTTRLKLTADQQAKVKDLFDKSEQSMAPLVKNQKVGAESFVKALTMENLKEAEVNAAARGAMNAELAIIAEKVKTLFALRQLLTPEQNNELDALIKSQSVPWTIGRQTPPPSAAPVPADDKK